MHYPARVSALQKIEAVVRGQEKSRKEGWCRRGFWPMTSWNGNAKERAGMGMHIWMRWLGGMVQRRVRGHWTRKHASAFLLSWTPSIYSLFTFNFTSFHSSFFMRSASLSLLPWEFPTKIANILSRIRTYLAEVGSRYLASTHHGSHLFVESASIQELDWDMIPLHYSRDVLSSPVAFS